MKRNIWCACTALMTLVFVEPIAAQSTRSGRQVQLISMGAMISGSAEPGSSPSSGRLEPASSDLAFFVHDLSRRYVQFRMEHKQAATDAPVLRAQASLNGPIAATSSIPVPFWMRPGGHGQVVATPIAFVPGCTPAPYRRSGLLRADAEARREKHYGLMSAIACDHGIPVGLFDAMIMRESRYDPFATSPKSAFGLAQLMPATAAGLGVDRFDVTQNLRGGARYLRRQLDRFGQVHLALAAYNAGPGRVRGGTIPRIAETQAYVADIMNNWSRLSKQDRSVWVELPPNVRKTGLTEAVGATISQF